MEIDKQQILYNQRRNEALNNRLKKEIALKEKEIKNVNDMFNKKIKDVKNDNDAAYFELQNENNKKILESLDNREQRLERIKSQLEEDQQRLDGEKNRMAQGHEMQIENLKGNFENQYRNIYNDGEDRTKLIDEQNSFVVKELRDKSNDDLQQLAENLAVEKALVTEKNQASVQAVEDKFASKLRNTERVHNQNQRIQENKFEQDAKNLKHRHEVTLADRKKAQDRELSRQEKDYQILMQQKEENFRSNLNQLSNNHDLVINTLKQKFDKEIKDLTAQHTKVKNNIDKKVDDDFYNVASIDPVVADYGKFYEVTVDVPQHEAENIRLSADGRELVLSMTRRYEGESTDLYGDINRTKRSETYTKKLSIPDMVNKKDITSKYENGAVIYRIAKM